MRQTFLGALFLCALTLGSCSMEETVRAKLAARAGAAKSYKTLKVSTDDCELTTSYSASIQGRQDVNIMPQVGGQLQQILVKEGQRVSKGQTMFIIDQVSYRASLSTAQANLKAAETNLATANLTLTSKTTLREQQVISEFELQTAKNAQLSALANVEQAKAAVVNAQNSLNYTVVKSPANGVVGSFPYRVGALVSPQMQTPLTTVSDNNEMYVYFSVAERKVMEMIRKAGSAEKAVTEMPAIQLRLSDGSIYEMTGKVETISGVVDKNTGSVSIRSSFANPNHILQSGGSGRVLIPTKYKNVIMIPQSAVFQRQDKFYVYKVTQQEADIYDADGNVSRGKAWVANSAIIEIEPNHDGINYIVTKGLKVGEEIIAEGAGLVKEGDQIKK